MQRLHKVYARNAYPFPSTIATIHGPCLEIHDPPLGYLWTFHNMKHFFLTPLPPKFEGCVL